MTVNDFLLNCVLPLATGAAIGLGVSLALEVGDRKYKERSYMNAVISLLDEIEELERKMKERNIA